MKKNKKKIKKNIKTIKRNKLLIAAALFLFVIYILYKVISLISNPAKTFVVEQGKIAQEETTIGYVIREENVIKGQNYKNGMLQIKAEGERVAKGEPIFRYYYNKEDSLVQKIESLDQKIDEAMLNEETIFTGDIKALENQIEEKIKQINNTNDLQKIKEYKKEISAFVTKKAKIAGELSPSGSYLKKLIDERSKYENELNSGTEYIKAPESGILSYRVDGYEEVLKPGDFSYITTEFLQNLELKVGQSVATSQESGKIINNFKIYIASILKSEESKNVEVGNKVKIRLSSGAQISAEIVNILDEKDARVIIFEVQESIQELLSNRKISFDIIWWSESGKKVPNLAIGYEEKNGMQIPYVIRTRAGYDDMIVIKILKQNQKYSIVDNVEIEEMRKMGYSEETIDSRSLLSLYDEVKNKPE